MISTSAGSISRLPSMLQALPKQDADQIAFSFSRDERNLLSPGGLSAHSSKDGPGVEHLAQPVLGALAGGGMGVCAGLAKGALGGVPGGIVGLGAGLFLGFGAVSLLLTKLGASQGDAYGMAAVAAVPAAIAGLVGGIAVGAEVSSPLAAAVMGLLGAGAGLLFAVSGDA